MGDGDDLVTRCVGGLRQYSLPAVGVFCDGVAVVHHLAQPLSNVDKRRRGPRKHCLSEIMGHLVR